MGDPVEIRRLIGKRVEILLGCLVQSDDDLFDLGMTSRKAAELIFWINQEFGVEIRLRSVFEDPEIGLLAEVVGEALEDLPA